MKLGNQSSLLLTNKQMKEARTTVTTSVLPLSTADRGSHSELAAEAPPYVRRFEDEEERENGGDEAEEAEEEGRGDEDEYEEEDEEDEGDEEERNSGGSAEEVRNDDDATVVAAAITAEEMAIRLKLADGYYEVEAIRKKRICKGEPQYLIKWRGWPESANTWEPVDHLQTCPDVVEAYEKRLQSGQKKGPRKRKRKFTPQKQKGQYSYGAVKSKTSPVKMPLGNEPQVPVVFDQSKQTQPRPGMVDLVEKLDEPIKRARSVRKTYRNGSESILPHAGSSERHHSDSAKLSADNASLRNSDVDMQQPMLVDGDGPGNQQSKSNCVEAGQSNQQQQRGAKRRKSGFVRRFTQDVASFNLDCLRTPLPVNVSSSDRVAQAMVGSCDAYHKDKSDSSRGSTVISKIIKPIGFNTSVANNNQNVSVVFVAMRSDGTEIMVDNNFLKSTYPLMLINFYEQHLRYTPS